MEHSITMINYFSNKFLPKNVFNNLKRHKNNIRNLFNRFRQNIKRPNIYNMNTQERVGVIYKVDTHFSIDERFLLYSIVRGLRPKNILEIGVLKGATAAIISAACEDAGQGKLVGLDPYPDITYPDKMFFGRFTIVEMASPAGIQKASEISGGLFDMVHFDSIVAHDPMKLDISGCLPYLADPAFLLINNSVHYGVNQAIQELVESNDKLHDCGFIGVAGRIFQEKLTHGTLRLLRFSSNNVADPQPIITTTFEKGGKPAPSYDSELINHDPYYCRLISPCPYCIRNSQDITK